MPFDKFNPDTNITSSIVNLANIVGQNKLLWVACRNQSTPMPQELQGIRFKKLWILLFGTKLLCISIHSIMRVSGVATN